MGRVQALMMGVTAAVALTVPLAGCGGGDDNAGASTNGFELCSLRQAPNDEGTGG